MVRIALVVLDTLRKESFDRHFDWVPGLRFEQAWSHSSWTVPAHGALFTGSYPRETGVYAKSQRLDYEQPVLAERLSAHGFSTRAFSANAFVAPPFDFDRGFDTFETTWRGQRHDERIFDWGDFISRTRDKGPSRYLNALYECVVSDVETIPSLKNGLYMKARDWGIDSLGGANDGASAALQFIRSTEFDDEEFFYLNLMEAHSPYKPPETFRTVDPQVTPGIQGTIENEEGLESAGIEQAYEDSAEYLSHAYRDIFEELAADFDYVITMSDHGESFGTDGVWGHCHGIHPELVHVPLCLYQGTDEKRSCAATVGVVDVYETIVEIAGISSTRRHGEPLHEDPTSRPQLIERFGLLPGHIRNLRSAGFEESEIERYDAELSGIALPNDGYGWETRNGFETEGTLEDEAALRDRLADLTGALDDRGTETAEESEVDDSVKRRLERLGYR